MPFRRRANRKLVRMTSEAYISSSLITRTLLPPFTCTGIRTFLQPRGQDVLLAALCLAVYYQSTSTLIDSLLSSKRSQTARSQELMSLTKSCACKSFFQCQNQGTDLTLSPPSSGVYPSSNYQISMLGLKILPKPSYCTLRCFTSSLRLVLALY